MKSLLFLLDSGRRASPFDITMAYDAGFDIVIPYENVTARDAKLLVQDAMFSRSPKAFKNTCFFISGRDINRAKEILKVVQDAMFPPYETSVIMDPSGAYTTAVAMVAKVEDALSTGNLGKLSEKKCAVFGTGPVGVTVAEILTSLGCKVIIAEPNPMLSWEYLLKHEAVRGLIERHGAYIEGAFAPRRTEKRRIVQESDIVFCAAARGVQVIEEEILRAIKPVKILVDINAVPPLGIEGVEIKDDMREILPGIYGIGALVVGDIKYKLQKEVLKQARENETSRIYDFNYMLKLARQMFQGKKKAIII